jgi:isoaspartyl peptidase/L-asparaginase-like protein (Ntn-hydrolase superfamily)
MSAHRAHHQPLYIIATHGGAGYHQPVSDSSLKRSLRAAISSALPAFSGATVRSDITSSGGSSSESSSSWSALDATTAVIAALEDHPDFNAGYGSNLTFDGRVECDASLMLSTTEERSIPSLPSSSSSSPSFSYSFGSVGAVRGVRNPVLLARCVLEERIRERERGPGMARMGMGRVPPLMLVGEGAVQFGRERGVRVVDAPDSEEMVAPRAREEWRVWRERCSRWKDDDDGFESRGLLQGEEKGLEDAELEPLRVRQDTVGAVVLVGDVEQKLEVAAGVSRCVMYSTLPPLFLFLDTPTTYFLPPGISGGILLKHSGRVGEVSRSKCLSFLRFQDARLLDYFYRQRYLVLAAGRNDRLVDAASLVVSRDKGNSSCNHFWRKRWPREPLRVPRSTRTRSFDLYWLISSTVRR